MSPRHRRTRAWAVVAAASLSLIAMVAIAPPAAAKLGDAVASSAHRPSGVSGCEEKGELEICFSSPPTSKGSDGAVINRMRALFRSAGGGDAIRIAMFRWEIKVAAEDLLAAQRRGAQVQFVADDDVTTNKVGRRLLSRLEAYDARTNDVVVCRGACLPWRASGPAPGSQDVNHLKLILADIDGEQSVLSTSSNLSTLQYRQYNSLFRVSDQRTYRFHLAYFKRLKAQSTRGWDDRDKITRGRPTAFAYPRRGDLVVNTLRQVRCGPGMRQVDVMVAVIQRYDVRQALGLLDRSGCVVRVVVDRELVENWIQTPVQLADGRSWDIPNDRVRTVSNHDKVYAIHARIGGKESWTVLTGTSNATCGGLYYNDEVMMRLDGKFAFRQYAAHFADAYRHAHQSPNPEAVPTQSSCP